MGISMTVYRDDNKNEVWKMPSRVVVVSTCFIMNLTEFLSNKRRLQECGFGEDDPDSDKAFNNGFIYVLLGQKDEDIMEDMDIVMGENKIIACVGQSTEVTVRLPKHRAEKSWIQKIITICHPIFNDKNAREFYEQKLWIELEKTGRFKMDNIRPNGTKVEQGTEDAVMLDVHPDVMKLLEYVAVKTNPFKTRSGKKIAYDYKVHIERNSPNKQPYAHGELRVEGGVTVFKDSYCFEVDKPRKSAETTKRNYKNIEAMQEKLLKEKILDKVADPTSPFKYIFISDYSFSKLSAASSLILGKKSSGPETWIHSEGINKDNSVEDVQKDIIKNDIKKNKQIVCLEDCSNSHSSAVVSNDEPSPNGIINNGGNGNDKTINETTDANTVSEVVTDNVKEKKDDPIDKLNKSLFDESLFDEPNF